MSHNPLIPIVTPQKMRKIRTTAISALTILLGWISLLGGAGVAVLCIHEGDAVHFLNETDDVECCDEKKKDHTTGFSAVLPINGCNHCFDLEIKGTESDSFYRPGVMDIPAPKLDILQRDLLALATSKFEFTRQILPFLRAPPSVTTLIDLGIRKTVLRL